MSSCFCCFNGYLHDCFYHCLHFCFLITLCYLLLKYLLAYILLHFTFDTMYFYLLHMKITVKVALNESFIVWLRISLFTGYSTLYIEGAHFVCIHITICRQHIGYINNGYYWFTGYIIYTICTLIWMFVQMGVQHI